MSDYSEYPKAMAAELKRLDKERQQLTEMEPNLRLLEECFDLFGAKVEEGEYNIDSTSASMGLGQVGGSLLNLRMTKDEKITDRINPVLKWLAQKGWKIHGKPSDYEEMGRRTYTLIPREAETTPNVHMTIKVQVFTYLGEGAVCSYVKTGTKEVDVLELRCEPEEVEA